MAHQTYPTRLWLNIAYSSDTSLDLHLSISSGTDSSKIYDKRNDFPPPNEVIKMLDSQHSDQLHLPLVR